MAAGRGRARLRADERSGSQDYTPEQASAIAAVAPQTERGRWPASRRKRTNILTGEGNAGKYYHGDLMERAMLLMLALTGNWGRKGTGVRMWTTVGIASLPPPRLKWPAYWSWQNMLIAPDEEPTMSDELAAIEMQKRAMAMGMAGSSRRCSVWYYHAGYWRLWKRRAYHDPSMARPFDEYFEEAVERAGGRASTLPGAGTDATRAACWRAATPSGGRRAARASSCVTSGPS